ncbi:formimidoylglutamate deiminase [Cohaesibacter gelatinilyticus]|uniref:Formiminoglutamate deiminase n=1 Tax=Cohaesibacter gelatinilyticus TaxID=372072 RepID=A0A285PFF4_9HYPH|nr:formimidoylglutamate deiminase [Cohaesibacter gelatinilyticus]SNZ20168.1 formiminoglutamate deiminase [Cohaesibacter gelatinilyticus]
MVAIFANQAYLASGWAQNVRLELTDGSITSITPNSPKVAGDSSVDILLPSLANLHSHAFQRAMAGMTEHAAKGRDSFWTWRQLMYRFLGKLSPDHVEAIASLVYMEMLEAGYASVGEFHYVHHQPDGSPYDNLAQMSLSVMAAAEQSGIGLTHLPVLYSYGGAGKQDLAGGQMRFGNDVERFIRLVEEAKAGLASLDQDARIGIAPHSLRASCPEDLRQVLANHASGPVHIHISEQPKEVEDVKAWLGHRPIEWLLANIDVDERWCLIHATHMTDQETIDLARSGAVAGLCPITEANLGDGPFNGPLYWLEKGAFGVGSDSNVRISLTEELRTLEYSQRLRDFSRNVLIDGEGSVGEDLYRKAAIGGAQALGRKAGIIDVGMLADLVAIDSQDMALCALTPDQLLDGLTFAAGDNVIRDVWSAGRHMVRCGQHIAREAIMSNYRKAVTDLLA